MRTNQVHHAPIKLIKHLDQYLQCADVIFEMKEGYQFQRHNHVAEYLRNGDPSLRRQHEQPTYRNTDLHRTVESRSLQLQSSIFTENDEHSREQRKLALLCYFLRPAGLPLMVLFPVAAVVAAVMKKMPGKPNYIEKVTNRAKMDIRDIPSVIAL